jgi:hypothetical protein
LIGCLVCARGIMVNDPVSVYRVVVLVAKELGPWGCKAGDDCGYAHHYSESTM